jgi:hypothetical protein
MQPLLASPYNAVQGKSRVRRTEPVLLGRRRSTTLKTRRAEDGTDAVAVLHILRRHNSKASGNMGHKALMWLSSNDGDVVQRMYWLAAKLRLKRSQFSDV